MRTVFLAQQRLLHIFSHDGETFSLVSTSRLHRWCQRHFCTAGVNVTFAPLVSTSLFHRWRKQSLSSHFRERRAGGVDTASEGGVFDISNADRLGFSEVELVQMVVDGVEFLIACEKKLENGQDIDADVDGLEQK